MKGLLLTFISTITLLGCGTTPVTGRNALRVVPESQLDEMGVASFEQMKKETPIESDPAINAYVLCIVNPVAKEAEAYVKVPKWEVVVFRSSQVNAFALPGGKIGVYTGILTVADTADQLAAVLGHEVGHVIAQHGNERVSQTLITQGGVEALSSLFSSPTTRATMMGLMGTGAQLGVLLPFSRKHESEADVIGLKLMAPAGFNPNAAVTLWENMSKAGGGAPPEIFSTHPSNERRISDLRDAIPSVMDTYKSAVASGKKPSCIVPKIPPESLPPPPQKSQGGEG